MNKKIPVLSLMGLMLVFPATAFAQPQVQNLFTAELPTLLTIDADDAIELQWVQGEKEFVEEVDARADKVFLGGDYLATHYKSLEVTPIVGVGLFGINVIYRW